MRAIERQRSWRQGNVDAGAATPGWYRESLEARAVEREELEATRQRRRRFVLLLAGAAAVGALLPAVLPLTPGYSAVDTWAEVPAAAVAALAALAVVPVSACL